ncbi:MAG: hypothetical protein C1943_03815 [Halochromatium sp.]|nr:hypothetical protein [Halochromatium sp.]
MSDTDREALQITLTRLHRCCWPMMPLELQNPGVLLIDDRSGNSLEIIGDLPELPDSDELEGLA